MDEGSVDELDCDTIISEGLDVRLADVQAGVCSGALNVCDGDQGWVEPGHMRIEGYDELLCDGLEFRYEQNRG